MSQDAASEASSWARLRQKSRVSLRSATDQPRPDSGCAGARAAPGAGFTQADIDFLVQVANQIAIAIENALAYGEITELKNQLSREKLYLEDEIRSEKGFEEIIGRSAAIRAVLRDIETVAPTDSTVLIYGETGTGKELVARAIHERSPRYSNAFVKLNCAAIPTGLLESELFGHEKGAFTGAIMQRTGRFELANHGTAFLDEIAEISLELQPKLLRVLQEREFERLGSTRTLKTDARLIAATNRDLADMRREEDIPRGPVLPAERLSHSGAASSRSGRRYSAAGEALRAALCPPDEQSDRHHPLGDDGGAGSPLLAGKYSRIAEFGRTFCDSVFWSGVTGATCGPSFQRRASQAGAKRRTLEEAEREHILTTLKETKWVVSGPRGAAHVWG